MKLNNKGFGAIEVVLIIAIVGVLGFVGYRAYTVYTTETETNEGLPKRDTAEEKNKKSVEKNTVNEDENKSLTVDAWDIKIPLSDEVNVSYELESNNQYAKFYTEKMKSSGNPGCMNYLYVARGKADQKAGVSDAPADDSYTFKKAYNDYPKQYGDKALAENIGDYYYIEFVGGGGACDNMDLISSERVVLRNLLTNAEEL